MTARTHGVVVLGVEGHVIDVEVHIAPGLVGTTIVGLPDAAVAESRDRAKAAVQNSGCRWPDVKVTVGLSPAALHKRGPMLDLAIALAVLAADGQVPSDELRNLVCVGELALDGRLRPMSGVVVAALGAQRAGHVRMLVPRANADEARLVPGVSVQGVTCLSEVVAQLRGEVWQADDDERDELLTSASTSAPSLLAADVTVPDLLDVRGQAAARHALEVAAAGGHHMALLGPPGVGKTMLAERLTGLLPELDAHAALEVTAIHSVAGRLPTNSGVITRAPFEAPHHTATFVAMVGGGGVVPRVGLVSLAHLGVLFLDEAPEFATRVLDALRQPLESGRVHIARAGYSLSFPAQFQLVMAANPCPCGYAADGAACRCSPAARSRYVQRLSGPLLDRIDIRIELSAPSRAEMLLDSPESSAVVAPRVHAARARAQVRLAGTPWRVNAEVPGPVLRRQWPLTGKAGLALARALDRGILSARGTDRVVRLAWTLADLAERDSPDASDVYAALGLRDASGAWAA